MPKIWLDENVKAPQEQDRSAEVGENEDARRETDPREEAAVAGEEEGGDFEDAEGGGVDALLAR